MGFSALGKEKKNVKNENKGRSHLYYNKSIKFGVVWYEVAKFRTTVANLMTSQSRFFFENFRLAHTLCPQFIIRFDLTYLGFKTIKLPVQRTQQK